MSAGAALLVLAAPTPATVQDLGRHGLAHLGVGPSGAADRTSLRQANRLLGNAEGAAAVEVTLGGLRVRAVGDLHVAVTGAPCTLRVDGPDAGRGGARDVGVGGPVHLADGEELELVAGPRGLRSYVAVRGGVRVPPVLGSRATDVLAGLGPPPLTAGDRLDVGSDVGDWPGVDHAPWLTDPAPDRPLRAVLGPREDWFAADAVAALSGSWRVSADATRTAVVLDGPPLRRVRTGELASEPVVRGAVQVPPSGRPTVLLADHPVTGGYPVLAVLRDADTDRLAQLRPGDPVRLLVEPAVRW